MKDQPTCGKGLAEHSFLPAKIGELIASVSRVLEIHMKALDLKDRNSRQEYDAYQKLAQEHREIAARLAATAKQMAECRDLPMGRHDEKAMSDPKILESFGKFINLEGELLALLQKRIEEDQKMFAAMSEPLAGR